jgi:flavin reductase (DIM6/NTAB) family NADH-FMN oxidoreductase RutF
MNPRAWARLLVKPIPQWAPIGLPQEQRLVDVWLRGAGEPVDIEGNHVVVSLAPLTIAVGQARVDGGEIVFVDRRSGRELGRLRVRRAAYESPDPEISFLEVDGGEHACLPFGLRAWQRLMQSRRRDTRFHLSNADAQHLMLFYLRPRPVVLVSVDDGVNDNLFPMDLIGTLRDRLTLALRTTSPSVATLRASRRVALSDISLRLRDAVYRLGKHHQLARIDWSSLPFASVRSAEFGLRVPADAQRLRECTIESWTEVGTHSFFMCRIVSDRTLGDEPRLHHTSGIHRAFRQRAGSLPWQELADARSA